MKISELYFYPLKSARAQKASQLFIDERGPRGDREWMLIDEKGNFLSQRTCPKMATIEVFDEGEALTIGLGKMFFKVSKKSSLQRKVTAILWGNSLEVALEPDLYSQGISQYLGVSCRLVRFAPFTQRTQGKFSDSRPLLLVSKESLQELNKALHSPVEINRFRPNLVIEGGDAFAEESFKRLRIGDVILSQPKPCSRCKIITVDQQTGESQGPEPLLTLAKNYNLNGKACFGVLWFPENQGMISVNDTVEVLE